MYHDIRSHLTHLVRAALERVFPDQRDSDVFLERPKLARHGDFSCNLPMRLSRPLKRAPREIAQLLAAAIPESPFVDSTEIAGTGFINFYLRPSARLEAVRAALTKKDDFGRSESGGKKKLQIEFVSANPTGPLHVGHGRGAVYGASLANLMAFSGWDVTREYYVNDAGRQMDILAVSVWLRYLALFNGGGVPAFPTNAYQGDYVVDMARRLKEKHGSEFARPSSDVSPDLPSLLPSECDGEKPKEAREALLDAMIARAKALLGDAWPVIHHHVLMAQLAECRNDLEEFGVFHDIWFSEKALHDTGLVARCVEKLEIGGYLYEKDGAKWFRSTSFGDEKDRVVLRDNGAYTYFASDIAYHLNKFERGFDRIVDIWGADHHGYIPRVKGAVAALGLDAKKLEIALVQFAVLYRDGKKVSMSTRSAEFISLRTLREEVGNDACHFFYVLRKSDQHLDFDLDLAKSRTNENPVYYIQYAHARLCSVLAQWGGEIAALDFADLSRLDNPLDLVLASRLGEFPEVVEAAARDLAPHAIAFYLKDLAADFHSYYNAERILVDDQALKIARLALATAVRQVVRNGLKLLGVSCPESM
ncbi:MAG: arginine--tRNA ligase [Candidatus Accumulibacter sp.]|jgi:arginyl-tRNA synthetase|nr:arginine--tRNA ligase [Accumulibacter sp.]